MRRRLRIRSRQLGIRSSAVPQHGLSPRRSCRTRRLDAASRALPRPEIAPRRLGPAGGPRRFHRNLWPSARGLSPRSSAAPPPRRRRLAATEQQENSLFLFSCSPCRPCRRLGRVAAIGGGGAAAQDSEPAGRPNAAAHPAAVAAKPAGGRGRRGRAVEKHTHPPVPARAVESAPGNGAKRHDLGGGARRARRPGPVTIPSRPTHLPGPPAPGAGARAVFAGPAALRAQPACRSPPLPAPAYAAACLRDTRLTATAVRE